MKKTLTFLFCLSMAALHAQITNGGFESLNSQNIANYWAGKVYLLDFYLDSGGHSHTDSVIYDKANYQINTSNPYSGKNALELRNAYNYTRKKLMPGIVFASTDTIGYTGFGGETIPLSGTPESLGFQYMFTNAGNDTAYVQVIVYDEMMNVLGTGELNITANAASYTVGNVPVNYTSQDQPAYAQVMFSTSKPERNGTLGTVLTLDEVQMNYKVDINTVKSASNDMLVYPNPSNGEFYVFFKKPEVVNTVTMTDVTGKVVQFIDPVNIPLKVKVDGDGLFVVVVQTNTNTYKYKIVVRH